MQNQFEDGDGVGTNSLAASFGSHDTPKIASHEGQQKVVIANDFGREEEDSTKNFIPFTEDLQCGHCGFISFMDCDSFYCEFEPKS